MVEDHGKTSAGSSRLDPITSGVFREPQHLGAVIEERPTAPGSEEGGSDLEHGQVGDQVDRCFPLVAGEGDDAGREIGVREARRGSERVRIHAFVYHDEFRALSKALACARGVAARSVHETGSVGAGTPEKGEDAFQQCLSKRPRGEASLTAGNPGPKRLVVRKKVGGDGLELRQADAHAVGDGEHDDAGRRCQRHPPRPLVESPGITLAVSADEEARDLESDVLLGRD